jgi:hypothetical protein
MNIKGYSERLTIKKQRLKEELQKPKEEQNKYMIRRLEESIRRNKNIALHNSRKRRKLKWHLN